MKKTVIMIVMLLLTSVWSNVCAGLYDNQSRAIVSSTELTLCTPGTFLLGNYEFAFPKADSTTHLQLEYFDMLNCYAKHANLTLLPSSIIAEPIRDTICAGETITWNGKTYTKPGSYTDTLQNIYGCDSIVTLHLEVLPDPPITFTVNGVSFNMMRVRAGSFMMGATDDDPDAEADEFPRHKVTLTKDYFIGETEMTQALWQAIMGNNPSEDKSNPQSPVNNVSWDDCQEMIAKLNELTGLTFRLPTEAEWEYAARAGHYSRGYIYAGSNNIDEVAWYNKPYNASVASLKPNELGLYDMSGSVYEWCQDWYDPNSYASPNHRIDPFQATSEDGRRCLRGGSNKSSQGIQTKKYSRIANRGQSIIDSRVNSGGVRLALEATGIMENNREFVTYDTICSGESYTWNGNTYTKPGSYTDTLSNIHGCDSIVTLYLHVRPDPPLTFTVNGVSFKMMRVRAGTFMMGATPEQGTDAQDNEKPAHQVTLTRDYFMAETMLTQELWTAVMGTTIQEEETKGSGDTGLGYGANYPMYCISYYDCLNFVERLNQLTGLTFRMPTEAEWEYAARGGHLSRGYKYPGSNDPHEVAWNVSKDSNKKLHEVKQLLPNELGLYDMAGNTWEWIFDYNRQYKEQSQTDPIGDTTSNYAFIRGGSSYYSSSCNRVSCRGKEYNKTFKANRIAFRFVLDADRVIGEDNTTYQAYDTICAGETYEWNGEKYTESGIYTKTLQNIYGCDSIVTLHLEVNPTYEVHDTIVACDSYTWHEDKYEVSGVYYDSLQSINGCDSVFVLHLTINHSILQEYHKTAFVSYTWKEGKTYTQSGVYYDSLSTIYGCDSIEILHLTILPPTEYFVYDTLLCYSTTCEWRELQLNTEGTYNDTVKNQLDCDSVIYTLNLNYLPDVEYIEEDTLLCHGITCNWRGLEFESAGTYNDTVKNQLDCDSIIYILNLEYLPDVVFVEEDTLLCYGATCEWRDMQLTTADTYKDTVKNQLNCDSLIYILNLNYLPDVVYIEQDTLLCHGATCEWRNMQLTTADTYNDTVKNQLNCDSVIYILNLNYLPDVVYIEQDTLLCYGATCEWRNMQLTTADTYKDTVKNQLNCDSVIYILNLNYLPDVVYIEQDTLLCHGATCEWRNMQLTTADTYNDMVKNQLNCDSVIYILNLKYLPDVVYIEEDTLLCHGGTCEWRNLQLTTSGTYNDTVKNQLDCDSVIYILNLEYLPDVELFATDTALCYGEVCDWRGVTYKESGIYHDTIRNSLSCDSLIYTLNLVIYPEIPITHVIDTMAGAEYHWNDQIYTHGGDYTVTLPAITGCDSVVILHLMDNYAAIDTVIVYEQCAGSGQQEVEILTQGYIEQIVLNYSPQAQAAGLRDTVMPLNSTSDIYTIYYDLVRAGVHEVTAIGLFHGIEVASYPFTLTYLYPNTIFEQRYNDLIAVLTHDFNGGYDFSAFQWYKDGVLLPGETHSYLNQPLSFESEYSVLLTNTDGLQLMSCPIIAENKAELSVYPTILKHGEIVKCHMTDENMLFIHNSTGKILQEQPLKAGTTEITLPAISGVYLFRFVSNDHTERTFKVIVQ